MSFAQRKAKTKQEYINAWTLHVDELSSVLYEAGIPFTEWPDTQQPLYDLIKKAAERINFDV